MWKNKSQKLILGVLIILLVHSAAPLVIKAAGENQDLFLDVLTKDVSSSYHTTTVTKEEFIISGQLKGTVIFPESDDVVITDQYDEMYFKSYLVYHGQKVKKGDKIAEISVKIDKNAAEELRLSIQREEDNLSDFTYEYEKLTKQYTKEQSAAKSEDDRLLAKLLSERLLLSYQIEKQSKEANIKELKNQYQGYQDLENNGYVQYVYASRDGLVFDYNNLSENDKVETGTYIATITNIHNMQVQVDEGSTALKYNMPVTISQMGISMKGRVITCNGKYLSPYLLNGKTLIEVEDENTNLSSLEVTVNYVSADMKNALVVDSAAIFKDEFGTYVNVLSNGLRTKQHVLCGASNSNKTWIIRGAKEGDIVLFD